MSAQQQHRWVLSIVVPVNEERGAEIFALGWEERMALLPELVSVPEGRITGGPTAVRGPMCSECTVNWEDVHKVSPAWPCPGKRPDDIGGSLERAGAPKANRRERRRAHEAALRVRPAPTSSETVRSQLDVAIAQARHRKESERRALDVVPAGVDFADPPACRPQMVRL